jgi:hypothetical protein
VKFIDNATCITYSIFYIILGTPLNCLHVNFIHYYYLPIIHGWSLSLIWSWIIFKHIQLTFLKCCALPIRKVENLSCSMNQNRIGGVMVILLTSRVRVLIGSNQKLWHYHDNVDMSIRGLLYQWASIIKIQLSFAVGKYISRFSILLQQPLISNRQHSDIFGGS